VGIQSEIAEAEGRLYRAWERGENADIVRAAERAYEKATDKPLASLHQSALWYASVGLRVFPLIPGSKIPWKGSNGCLGASANPDVINGWWDESPLANIGLATGGRIDVVDIDGLPGQTSRAQHWDDIFGRIDGDALAKVNTPRPGGMHIYVPATGDGNRAGIVPGIDYRGRGGYVVAPPSVITEEAAKRYDNHTPGQYLFLGTPSLEVS
jgi:hypothetical protein